MREHRRYGKHDLYIEEEILFSVPHGEMVLSEAQLFNSMATEIIARYGYCMILGNLKDSEGIEASARRYSANWAVGKPVLGIALFNQSPMIHTMFTLLLKAMNLLRRQQPVPVGTFKTEQEARDWLAQLRRQHLAKLKQEPTQPAS